MFEIPDSLPKKDCLPRYDGTCWRVFNLPNRGVVVLTNRGQEILSHNPNLRRELLNYKNEAKEMKSGINRRWFRSGGNSDVYNLGDKPFVVKEASTSYSVWGAIDRMDYLHGICLRFLPPHIRVPDQYGIFYSGNLPRQYLFMQKVNAGLTMADLIHNSEGYPSIKSLDKSIAMYQFKDLKNQVLQAIDRSPGKEYMPKSLLPDWNEGNIVVDFTTPNVSMPFTFWIIDQ